MLYVRQHSSRLAGGDALTPPDKTEDPRIPTITPRRSTSGFHRTRCYIACTNRETPRNGVWQFAWRVSCILPSTTCGACRGPVTLTRTTRGALFSAAFPKRKVVQHEHSRGPPTRWSEWGGIPIQGGQIRLARLGLALKYSQPGVNECGFPL